jgi:serine phosphatase RsbU (regulator of sigma subunit)
MMAKLSAEARFYMMTESDPAEAFNKLNEFIIRAGLTERFITLAGAILDVDKHHVTIVNAGHLFPQVFRASTEEVTDVIDLNRSGFPLGIMPGTSYITVETTLEPGDSLMLFTDGVTDALNTQGKQFTIGGVRTAMSSDSIVDGKPTPARLGQRVVEAVQGHITGRDQYDDIALVSFGRYDALKDSASQTQVGM